MDAKLNKVNEAIKNPGKAAENYAKNMVKNLNPVSADIVRVNTGKGQAADEALAIVLTAKRTMDSLPPGVPMQVKLVAAGAMVVATETKRIVKLVEWQSRFRARLASETTARTASSQRRTAEVQDTRGSSETD